MPGAIAQLPKQDLFARLAEGHAAGITVVTPNLRLARVLRAEFDDFQIRKNLAAWEDADILPFSGWLERLYEEALYAGDAAGLPQLLSPAQERRLWEEVLAGAALLSLADTAADCASAWRLAHAWRIEGALGRFPGNADTQAFAGWAREYAKRCDKGGWIDAARLPDLEEGFPAKKPKLLVAYAFDILPPQVGDFFDGLGVAVSFCRPGRRNAIPAKTSFPSARHELEAAASWARARLEAGAKRIGVVVPGLEQRRKEVVRVFSRAMHPGHALPGAQRAALPVNVSLGERLDGFAIVDFALQLLEFCCGEIEFAKASRIVRSPFLGGAQTEMLARARLEARLRRELASRVSLGKLLSFTGPCPLLRSLLEKLFEASAELKSRQLPPHDWAQRFTGLLQAAGFPGERALDSGEFQARAKLNEVLGEFSRLSFLQAKMPVNQAISRLRGLCAETLFQPESPDVPVQVIGVLESAGMEFDCLWVSGLTEESWPLKARPHPFLPVALQKQAGIPEAAAETSLALDRHLTEGWLAAADEVVLSWPRKEQDRDLVPSPLIAQLPEGKIEVPALDSFRDLLFRARRTETIPDGKASPLREKTVKGGTRVLADQAACPFRAFARHRLNAEGIEAPSEGPDAMQRGQLLHTLMAGIWKGLKSSAALSGDLKPVIERSAAAAVKELGIEGRFAELERKRLEKLALEWLAAERERAPFEVVHVEEKRALDLGGLALQGRIDRMDRLADGSHALIDYKTGAQLSPRMWMGERPDEPQLPLYAVSAPESISAVAFARLKTGAMRYMGYSREKNALPGMTHYPSWGELIKAWKGELENLAAGFAAGAAQVDPKNGLATCRYCDLRPLCRVHERLSALAEADGEGE